MCFGSSKKQHHQQQERMRAETAQRNIFDQAQRDRQAELDRMMAMQQEADRRQQDALRMIADSSRQPFQLRTAAEAATPIMRTRQKTAQAGISSLRINRTPSTNVGGGGTASGTNIG
jgi:hypothetical protein